MVCSHVRKKSFQMFLISNVLHKLTEKRHKNNKAMHRYVRRQISKYQKIKIKKSKY
jgi:hypothetical protein